MHLIIKCQASFKYCNKWILHTKNSLVCTRMKLPVHAAYKTVSDTLVTVIILFEKESISMVIVSDNKHDKRTVVSYLFTVFNYVKEMFRENIQNIDIWTDMAHVVNLKLGLPLATLVITFISCLACNMELFS